MSVTIDELLDILICPESRGTLEKHEGGLRNPTATMSYPLEKGVPDLRLPPTKLAINHAWYEPWADLEALKVSYPEPVQDTDLPYHLDKYLAAVVPKSEGGWLLEVGCGEREGETWFGNRGYRYIGIDVDIRGPGPTVLADAHNLPIESSSIDCCASMAVLEHVVSPISVAQEVYRVLKPGGSFLGSAAFMYGFHDRASFHHMSHAGLLYVLRVAGFDVVQMWPDWLYADSISAWPFRGRVGLPWRLATRGSLKLAEWSFTRTSNFARLFARKPVLDLMLRDLSMAGSISFLATKPSNIEDL